MPELRRGAVGDDGYCEQLRHAGRPAPRPHRARRAAGRGRGHRPGAAAPPQRGRGVPGRPRRRTSTWWSATASPRRSTRTWPPRPRPSAPAGWLADAPDVAVGDPGGRRRRSPSWPRPATRGGPRPTRPARSSPPSVRGADVSLRLGGRQPGVLDPGRRAGRAAHRGRLVGHPRDRAGRRPADRDAATRRRTRSPPGWAPTPARSSRAPATCTSPCPGHLVLCSDGLWNYLTDPADFADTVRDAPARRRPARRRPVPDRVRQRSRRRGQHHRRPDPRLTRPEGVTVAVHRRDVPERVPRPGRDRGQRDRHGLVVRRRGRPPHLRRDRDHHRRRVRLDAGRGPDDRRPAGRQGRGELHRRRRALRHHRRGEHRPAALPGARAARRRRRRRPGPRRSASIDRLQASGGTAMGAWLKLAGQLFAQRPGDIAHAILLTDGDNGEYKGYLETGARGDRRQVPVRLPRRRAPTGRSPSCARSPPRCWARWTSSRGRPT